MMTPRQQLLMTALWWGLLTGLGEGLTRSFFSWYWRELMWSAIIFETLLLATPVALLLALRPSFVPSSAFRLRVSFAYCGLAMLDWIRTAKPLGDYNVAVLAAVAAASVVAATGYMRGE